VVETAIAAAPPGFDVIPGVAAYGWREAVRWTEHAAGCRCERGPRPAAQQLPGRRTRRGRALPAIAAVGLPVVAYNNRSDTKVDLLPSCSDA